MPSIPKWLSWILLFKPDQVYETCSIADALKTGERTPIIQRTFDHYFSAFLQSSNSLKQYEDRNFILQRILASFASLGAPDQSAKRYLKRLLLWSAVCNYARLRLCIFLSHKQNLCTSDRLENQYTWKWKKTKPDRKTYNRICWYVLHARWSLFCWSWSSLSISRLLILRRDSKSNWQTKRVSHLVISKCVKVVNSRSKG